MSQPDETPALCPSLRIPSNLIPTGEPQALPGPSFENPASLLDHEFNFQIVVFKVYSVFKYSHEEMITTSFQKVENTLFQVLRNGFNVPGTPFEAMFALPQTQMDSIEGSSLENPIHLPGIKVDHFRSFLRILYPLCVLMLLSVKYSESRIYYKILQHRHKTCRRIWWVGWSAEFSNYVGFPRGSVFALTEIFCAVLWKSWPRSEQQLLLNFQVLLNRRQSWKELF